MNRIVIFVSISLFLSCSRSLESSVESLGSYMSEGSVASCLCAELDTNDHGQLVIDGKVFTGNCFISYVNGDSKYIEKQIVNGFINGKIIYYSPSGEVLFEEKFQNGKHQIDLSIENIRCQCDELVKNEKEAKYYYKNQLFKGVCYRLFPGTEQPYVEITYAKGVRNGFTTYYSKLGDLLYTEKYELGTLVKVIYPEK
jgi:hypothetical protein